MKKFWKYFLILILLLLGLACVGILFLFFVPNSNLFGIQYVAYRQAFYSTTYDASTISKITLNSLNYDVRIVPSNDNTIKASVHSFAFGFLRVENNVLNITSSTENGELVFNVSEPFGAVVPNNSYVELLYPQKQLDLALNNNQANITINSSNIEIQNLSYVTTAGNFNLSLGKVLGTLDLDIGNSTFTLSSNVTTGENTVNLKLTTGKFDSSSCSLGSVNVLKNTRGIINLGQCQTLTQDVEVAGGSIKAKKVGQVSIKSSDTNVNFEEVSYGARIKLSSMGKINIGKISGSSVLITNNGDITIGSNNSALSAETKNGNIKVTDAIATVNVTTERGSVTVNFAEDAPAYSASSATRHLIASLRKGSLNCSGVDRIQVISTDNGSVKANLRNVLDDNFITAKNGNVNLIIEKSAVYKLVTKSTSGNVKVNLSQISNYGGYTFKDETTTYVNSTEDNYANNTLAVETVGGALKILDTNLI